MDMLARITTKADTRLWLQQLYSEASEEERPGLWAAIADILQYKFQLNAVGSVASHTRTNCMQTGVCDLASEGAIAISGLKDRYKEMAEIDSDHKASEKFQEFADRVTTRRLREADLSAYDEKDVVTTILPMCSVCWAVGALHLDHIVPKSKGGLNDYTNYQLLCAPCNSSKGDRDMDVWHEWVNNSEDEGALRIRERRSKNRRQALPKGDGE